LSLHCKTINAAHHILLDFGSLKRYVCWDTSALMSWQKQKITEFIAQCYKHFNEDLRDVSLSVPAKKCPHHKRRTSDGSTNAKSRWRRPSAQPEHGVQEAAHQFGRDNGSRGASIGPAHIVIRTNKGIGQLHEGGFLGCWWLPRVADPAARVQPMSSSITQHAIQHTVNNT